MLDNGSIIAISFHNRHGVSNRNEKQLRDLWRNLKTRAKSDVAAVRRSLFKTGGGTDDSAPVSVFSEKVCSILPQQIQSLTNIFDDDAEFHGDTHVSVF